MSITGYYNNVSPAIKAIASSILMKYVKSQCLRYAMECESIGIPVKESELVVNTTYSDSTGANGLVARWTHPEYGRSLCSLTLQQFPSLCGTMIAHNFPSNIVAPLLLTIFKGYAWETGYTNILLSLASHQNNTLELLSKRFKLEPIYSYVSVRTKYKITMYITNVAPLTLEEVQLCDMTK